MTLFGCCFQFKIYTGQDKEEQEDKDVLVSESIVLDIVQPILGKGCTLYLDNWYISPPLFKKLLDNKTYAHLCRKDMPKDFGTMKLFMDRKL